MLFVTSALCERSRFHIHRAVHTLPVTSQSGGAPRVVYSSMSKLPVPLSAAQHLALANTSEPPPAVATTIVTQSSESASQPAPQLIRSKRTSLPAIDATAAQQATAERRRSSPMAQPKPVQRRMTKNYMHMVHDYNQRIKYAKRPDGTYSESTLCVYCEAAPPRLVFFPCQHQCVCDVCIRSNGITNDTSNTGGWTACPVCMAEIHLMLPHTGHEEALYWKWTAEVKPTLPIYFKEEFKDAARRLRRLSTSTIQPDQKHHTPAHDKSTNVKQSDQQKRQTRANTAPLPSQHSMRRLSAATRKYTLGQSSAGTGRGNTTPQACTIL